jgi:hypothetical protein
MLLGSVLVLAASSFARAQADAPLEFRGVLTSGEKVTVGLFDCITGESFWISAKVSTAAPHGVSVRDYDPKSGRLTVDYHGRPYTLVLAAAVIIAAPAVEPWSPPDESAAANSTTEVSGQIAGVVQRRRSLRQVEALNQSLQAETGVDIFAFPGTAPMGPDPTSDALDFAPGE